MEEKRKSSLPINWPSVALLVALAGNLLWLQSPLRSSRPAETAAREGALLGDQKADARLWQDPFEAVELYIKANKSADAPVRITNALTSQITHREEKDRTNIVLMPVMVTGSQYAEGAEWRVRSRFALLSGLERAGYVSEDREHIGFFKISWPPGALLAGGGTIKMPECDTNSDLNLTVPFEWLVRYDSSQKDPKKDFVLVLWLHEELFEDFPLTRLAMLIQNVRAADDSTNNPLPVKIIGPWGSTTLREMFREETTGIISCSSSTDTVSNVLNQVTIYSPNATAADWRITGTITNGCTNGVRCEIAANLAGKTSGLEFINVTCTDDQLAQQLVEELKRRHVDLSEPGHRVALISEWDTFYGRALPQSFTNAVAHMTNCDPANAISSIWTFTYLRGLDGKLAGHEGALSEKSSSSSEQKDGGKTGSLEQLERPEGNSQLDYIPRLAAALKARERESILQAAKPGLHLHEDGKLEAIGLLGSDVYDKLLLLQSLRQRFPAVIFFTTDLDARLSHTSQLKWTRNLIVASSFGLALQKDLQGGVPPFRDTYQTAEFLAAQVALDTYTNDLTQALSPRLFEIGRYGPYDLSVATNIVKIHPPRANEFAGSNSHISDFLWAVVKWVLPVSLALFLFCLMSWKLRETINALLARKKTVRVFALALVFLLIYVAMMWKEHLSPGGEPFSILAGISVWPTELIRLAAAFLGFALVFKAVWDLQKDNDDLVEEFGVEHPGKFLPPLPDKFGIQYFKSDNPTKGAPEDGDFVWRQYNMFGRQRCRWCRCVPLMLGYFVFAWFLFLACGMPFVPGRGDASFSLDRAAVMMTVITLIVVTFYVMDATRLCTQFIKILSLNGANWPTEKTEQFKKDDKLWKLSSEEQNEWTTIRFIARRTEAVGKMIYYPFLVLFLLIISRNYFFDAWKWPVSLIIIQGFNVSFALFCALHLRRVAERARQKSLARLNERLSRELGSLTDGKTNSNRAEQIRLVIRLIENNEEGAFAPLSNQPIIGALAMPFGGASIMAVVEYFATH